MTLSVTDCTDAIRLHTRGLAAAAEGNLDARIEHCPDWSMADLVRHLIGVHRFWTQVIVELPTDEPEETVDADRPADGELVAELLAGMETMIAAMEAADQSAPCWTWGLEENVWFVTRHQVQEAAVHHWDAANAARVGSLGYDFVEDRIATDAVDEFLTHSVANRRWPNLGAEPLGGTIWFCPCVAVSDECPSWHLRDGEVNGTLALEVYEGRAPEIEGVVDGDHVAPTQLLLWLYRRLPDSAIDSMGRDGAERPLLQRFRAFTSTD